MLRAILERSTYRWNAEGLYWDSSPSWERPRKAAVAPGIERVCVIGGACVAGSAAACAAESEGAWRFE